MLGKVQRASRGKCRRGASRLRAREYPRVTTPMRILLTVDPELPVPPLFYGGVERIVNGLVRALVMRGHQVGLIAHAERAGQKYLNAD